MPIYNTSKGNALFIHIPKAAGTTVENALSSNYVGLLNRKFRGKYFPCSPQHFHSEVLEDIFDVDSFFYIFALVREPIDRLFSEYKFRCTFFSESRSFEKWWHEIKEEYQDNPWVLDNHIRPQSEFMLDNTEVFRIESGLDSLEKALLNKLGVEVSFKHSMKSKDFIRDISSSVERQIRDFYSVDYEVFGY